MKVSMVLLVMLFVCQCTLTNELICNCEEESIEVWTVAFIDRMKAGDWPDQADVLAVRKANEAKSRCIENLNMN
jgi:hypothetical protein